MATKSFDEIIQSFVSFLIRRNDLIDLKPTSITRTLLDSIANEIAVVNGEIDQVRLIQSVLNAADMSEEELDALAANLGVTRKTATFATVNLTFFLTREPSTDITVLEGTTVSTATDPSISGSVQFQAIESVTIYADRINSYFNPNTGFFEVSARAQALVPGASGNVAPNSLIRAPNTLGTGADLLLVTNRTTASGGADVESNVDFAARIFVSISGINVGTKDGYKSSALEVPGVQDAVVVGAGDKMMVRDFNSIGEHIGGRVDVYVQGEDAESSQDRIPFSLQQKFGQIINLIQGSVLEFNVPDPDLETFPLISVDRVYTIIPNPILAIEDQLESIDPDLSDEISVAIVSPLNGAIVDGGIDVLVRAFKPNGQITKVNLIINDELVREMIFDNARGLYNFTLNTTQFRDGVIQLQAEAFDERNQKAKTNPIKVHVRNLEDISVRILSPDAGSTVTGIVQVEAFAFSKAGIAPRGVEISYNMGRYVPMNQDTVANRFTFPLNAANFQSGPVRIDIRALDMAQRVANAVPRTVIIEIGRPDRVQTNRVFTMIQQVISRPGGGYLKTAGTSGTGGTSIGGGTSPGHGGGNVIEELNELTVGGNFNIARLTDPSSDTFTEESDKLSQDLLDDKGQVILDVSDVEFFKAPLGGSGNQQLVVVTSGGGIFCSETNGETFDLQINSGNTLDLPPTFDDGRAMEIDPTGPLYFGTGAGAYSTDDGATLNFIPLPTDKPVTAFGFLDTTAIPSAFRAVCHKGTAPVVQPAPPPTILPPPPLPEPEPEPEPPPEPPVEPMPPIEPEPTPPIEPEPPLEEPPPLLEEPAPLPEVP